MNTFLKKIPGPPAVLKNTLAFYKPGKGRKLPESLKAIGKMENFEPVIFRGMGSSCFTSFAALNLFDSVGIVSHTIHGSEPLHFNLPGFKMSFPGMEFI